MKGAAQNGDHEGRQMKGDKATGASRPFDVNPAIFRTRPQRQAPDDNVPSDLNRKTPMSLCPTGPQPRVPDGSVPHQSSTV